MKNILNALALGAVVVTALPADFASAQTRTELSRQAAQFDASRQGGVERRYTRADGRPAVTHLKQAGASGNPVADTSSYCVWQDGDGKWHAKKVNLLTVCVNSIKVTCTDGNCQVD